MMPPLEELARRFAAKGIGSGMRVVLYSRKATQWATRIWWMLRSIGFDNAAIPGRRLRRVGGGGPSRLNDAA